MNAGTVILWTAAAFIFACTPAYLLALAIRERRDQREDARRREAEDRAADAEWLAVLAATETPVYDQLVCECIEKAEGWA